MFNLKLIGLQKAKTYVLLHFDNKNDDTIIVNFVNRATSRRQSLIMIVTSLLCSKCDRTLGTHGISVL